ncbi:MAG: hypothetical protein WC734_01510 [Patescibacteria group bacterium]
MSPNITYDEAISTFLKLGFKEEYLFGRLFVNPGARRPLLLWGKDAVLFPEKMNGKFALLYRIYPDIQLAYFDSFDQLKESYWREQISFLNKHVVLEPVNWFENMYIGAGCPPIRTEVGWLLIYHGVERSGKGFVYRAAAALLDINQPTKVIGRLNEPLFEPTEPWEINGDVNNVVFPTGAIVRGDRVTVYYGAADRLIAAKTINYKMLLSILINSQAPHNDKPIESNKVLLKTSPHP